MFALNVSTDATTTSAWYLLGGTHYLYHFSCCDDSDPTDHDNGGVVTTASAITYGLDAYWTWPCAAGTFSADGYEHGDALDALDPTCEVDSTGSCTIGSVSTSCPLAGYCPDACSACPSGSYLEVADGSFNKHFQHITQGTCSLCPVGKWQDGATTPAAHDSLDDCEACAVGEYGDEVGATTCKVKFIFSYRSLAVTVAVTLALTVTLTLTVALALTHTLILSLAPTHPFTDSALILTLN